MRIFRILLVSILCLSMVFINCSYMCSALALFNYFVLVSDGLDVNQYDISCTTHDWTFVGSTNEGDIYHLFCAATSKQHDKLKELLVQASTERPGVIEYVPDDLHPQMGDTNADGQIRADDALLCLQVVVGKYQPQTMDEYTRFLVPDYPISGSPVIIDATCALNILKMVVGKY